ncbi:VOC family protein [Micromonospora sp. NPDC049366]|uniref:VOC family protein n=1 Tax=Micromonospora sp. NPDC049366 TaxID=3364271 RepID=UPI00378D0150
MALHWKLVVDCADAIPLARFWAAALDYEVEDNSDLIDRLVEMGAVGPEAYVDIDGRRAFRELAGIRHPDDPVDPDSGIGLGRRLLFQAVPEPKRVKNRLHLDLHVGPADREVTVKRLTGLGATVLAEVDERGSRHTTMADPEGNEFDVQ